MVLRTRFGDRTSHRSSNPTEPFRPATLAFAFALSAVVGAAAPFLYSHWPQTGSVQVVRSEAVQISSVEIASSPVPGPDRAPRSETQVRAKPTLQSARTAERTTSETADTTNAQNASTDRTATEAKGTLIAHANTDQVVAWTQPSVSSTAVETFEHPTPTGGPLVFQGLGDPVDGWLEVLLPIRPNGSTGWISLDDVKLSRNPYRIDIDLEQYELRVDRNDENVLTAPIGVGKTSTPTPLGDFYLIELLQPRDPYGPYGTYAYGLSGFSEVLESFNGGEGVVGIHGTNQPDLLGQPVSHGCIRVTNEVIDNMASFLPLGTPVTISHTRLPRAEKGLANRLLAHRASP